MAVSGKPDIVSICEFCIMYLHRCMAILTFTIAGLAAPAAHATLHYEERTEALEIGAAATDRNSIWQAVRRFGPEVDGTHAFGTTGAKISWTRSVQRGPLGCKIKSIDVTMNVSLALPAWQGRSRAAPDMQKYWDCVAKTATTHEKRHAQIWQETGRKLDDELSAIAEWMPCGQLDDLLKETAERIQTQARSRQAAFDDADRRRPRYEQCKAEPKKIAETAEHKDPGDADGSEGKKDAKHASDTTEQSFATDDGAETKVIPSSPSGPRLGTRLTMVSGNMMLAASSSLWLLLWLGGFLVAGAAAFMIVMKFRLNQGDEDAVEIYKERSALLRLARRVDASTGKHISRSSLPDRTGLRRRQLRPR